MLRSVIHDLRCSAFFLDEYLLQGCVKQSYMSADCGKRAASHVL